MATQKRRVVYFTDEEWEALRELSTMHEETISAYLRAAVAAVLVRKAPIRQPFVAPVERSFTPVPKPSQRRK